MTRPKYSAKKLFQLEIDGMILTMEELLSEVYCLENEINSLKKLLEKVEIKYKEE